MLQEAGSLAASVLRKKLEQWKCMVRLQNWESPSLGFAIVAGHKFVKDLFMKSNYIGSIFDSDSRVYEARACSIKSSLRAGRAKWWFPADP